MWRAWCRARPELPGGGRIVTLQLGAGCSATAIDEGRAVDTSMGFTPGEGLLMATRSGDIDPGLLIHLLREGIGIDALERLLMREGGLAGVSGLSGDMRVLLASDEPAARLAIDMYCLRARKYVGAYIAALGGVDGIVFGGGVGEHLPEVRARILQGLDAFGATLDAAANAAAVGSAARISTADSRIEVRVQPVDEAQVIAELAVSALRLAT
jgi:acetate kinase